MTRSILLAALLALAVTACGEKAAEEAVVEAPAVEAVAPAAEEAAPAAEEAAAPAAEEAAPAEAAAH